MHFVSRVCIPDDELAVLRCGYQVPTISRPMHCVDLGKMAFEGSLSLHGESGQLIDATFCNVAYYINI